MDLVRGIQTLSHQPKSPVVVTIGNFDGVHLGHQQIIKLTLDKARTRSGTAVAYTFRPHPQLALRPEKSLQLLCTYDEKLRLLAKTGIDAVVEEPFSREFSTVRPEEFFKDMLMGRLGAKAIVVGYDFAFGKERQGHLKLLNELCESTGVELTIVQPWKVGGETASSSRIRIHLAAGDLPAANRLLGREFSYTGIVSRGDARGRTIGFPTANLRLEAGKLSLPFGVYATRVRVQGEPELFEGVANIGVRPTFYQESAAPLPLLETHLLDQTIDLYGREIEVSFVGKLRDEMKFGGLAELKAQIQRDVERAREVLRNV